MSPIQFVIDMAALLGLILLINHLIRTGGP